MMQQPVIAASSLAPAVDMAHLEKYTLGNRELEIEILDLFVGQAPQTIERMAAAADQRQWREAAHTLKGSARGVGAWRLGELALAAERLPSLDEPATRAALLGEISQALAEVAAFVRELGRSDR